MGVEGEKFTIDGLLQQIDAGEITRGEKGQAKHMLPNGVEGIYKLESQTFTFTHNLITAEAVIQDGTVQRIELTDPRSGNTVFDEKIKQSRREYLQQLLDSRELIL